LGQSTGGPDGAAGAEEVADAAGAGVVVAGAGAAADGAPPIGAPQTSQ